jgi:hypothetical protein
MLLWKVGFYFSFFMLSLLVMYIAYAETLQTPLVFALPHNSKVEVQEAKRVVLSYDNKEDFLLASPW